VGEDERAGGPASSEQVRWWAKGGGRQRARA
jgi:hypothetical protein